MTNKDLKDRDVVIAPVGAAVSSTATTPTSLVSNGIPTGAVYAGGVPIGTNISKKPSYLVTLEDNSGKTKTLTRFLALDHPTHEGYFVHVKGFFSDLTEDDLIKRFGEVIQNTAKELYVEMFFPVHRVSSIRSLIFNAIKPTSFNKEVR